MSQERITVIRGTIIALEKKIRPLEWDLSRNQINEFRKQELGRLKVQRDELGRELDMLLKN